jgi:D-glycero-D-manno-heptose 1,7-bisphosphate phosphatase
LVARACAFLDRDGVINRKAPPGQYIQFWHDFEIIPTIADWIRLFNTMGMLVIVVTNQRGIARGLVQQAEVDDLHERMSKELSSRKARIDDICCCPHEYNTCDCRKPKPGLVLQAVRKWHIDLERSFLIGDSDIDAQLAQACDLPFIRVDEGRIVNVSARGIPGPPLHG